MPNTNHCNRSFRIIMQQLPIPNAHCAMCHTKKCMPMEVVALGLALMIVILAFAIFMELYRNLFTHASDMCALCDDSTTPRLTVSLRVGDRCGKCGDYVHDESQLSLKLIAFGYADYPRICEYPPHVHKYHIPSLVSKSS